MCMNMGVGGSVRCGVLMGEDVGRFGRVEIWATWISVIDF